MSFFEKIANLNNFQELIDLSYSTLLNRNPIVASYMGISEYHDKWPDISLNGVNKDINIIETINAKLQNIIIEKDMIKDSILLKWFLEFSLFELKELKYWESNPRLVGLILSGLNIILVTHTDDN